MSKRNNVRFFIDSGAGQCMCSCVEAFSTLRPCAILVVGVSGSLPIHGIGTANFVVKDSHGKEHIWKIHNCLLVIEVMVKKSLIWLASRKY